MRRRPSCATPLLLALMSSGAVAFCLAKGMDAVALGWTASAACALAWLARELDPRG